MRVCMRNVCASAHVCACACMCAFNSIRISRSYETSSVWSPLINIHKVYNHGQSEYTLSQLTQPMSVQTCPSCSTQCTKSTAQSQSRYSKEAASATVTDNSNCNTVAEVSPRHMHFIIRLKEPTLKHTVSMYTHLSSRIASPTHF